MTDPSRGKVTEIFRAVEAGDAEASSKLLPIVYEELRKLARDLMAKTPPGNTLQPTALVHEAYLRLVGGENPGWNHRGHFFGAAAQAMRRILVEQARRKARYKHGGGLKRLDADEIDIPIETPVEDMIALDEALERLRAHDGRKAEVVRLRYFAGLTIEETAKVLNVTGRTVERDWRFARALLNKQLNPADWSGRSD
jgi:RNA polymerase sigma factor (TIGR02999 family)